ncbi:MAG: UDP-N-acetylglucosamine 1-carboxyvinyltransferase [Oscillospiraceae bacterium]
MEELIISGGKKLIGKVRVHGAKNAVLPILAASLLANGTCVIHDCPNLKDVRVAFEILEHLGCDVEYCDGTAIINSQNIKNFDIPDRLMRKMRSSVIFLGAIISKMRKAQVSYPGGCKLGARPIDMHLNAMARLGVKINEGCGYINCKLDMVLPQNLTLIFPSVGATENIMLLAATSKGTTTIANAAREPEIVDLQNFLNTMGADIRGAGSDTIKINGVTSLHGGEYTVVADRIVAATYGCAVAACGGDIVIENIIPEHIGIVLSVLEDAGCKVTILHDGIRVSMKGKPCAVGMIKTLPYPGFPTDVQSQLMATMCCGKGTTVFSETIFDNRYNHVNELVRMGADISVDGRTAIVSGVEGLCGGDVVAADLRGGAALVIAGLCAKGVTHVSGIEYIDRGYESIERDLKFLDADIYRGVGELI